MTFLVLVLQNKRGGEGGGKAVMLDLIKVYLERVQLTTPSSALGRSLGGGAANAASFLELKSRLSSFYKFSEPQH